MDDGAHHSSELLELARRHVQLSDRAERTSPADPAAVLDLGATVLVHRALQVARASRILSWLDPVVSARIAEEQERLGEDLELLRELLESKSQSADAAALSGALVRRLRDQLQHDERVLHRPLARLLALDTPPEGDAGIRQRSRGSRRGEVS